MSKLKKLRSILSATSKETLLLKCMVENASDGIHILSKDGDVIYCSHAFADLLGYSYEEALKLNVKDWDRLIEPEKLIPIISDLIKNPKIFETKHMKKSGELFDVEINAKGIDLGGELYLYASSRDITEAKRENLTNKKNHAKLETIFHTMPDAFIVVDELGIIETVNEKSFDILGYTPPELIGRDISLIIPETYAEKFSQYINKAIKKKKGRVKQTSNLVAKRKNESLFPISLSVGRIEIEDQVNYTWIIKDISELQRKEKELIRAKNRAQAGEKAKSLFLANMSHEIRTPMNGIIGMVSMLNDTELDKQQKEMLSMVKSCGESLLTIINDILDYSKIEHGKLKIEKNNFNLRESLDEVVYIIANIASERGITIHTDIGSSVPAFLKTDVVRLRQIITNLLSNAVKFSENGSDIFLNIDLVKEDEKTASLNFIVKDNGIGMSEEEKSKLFKEFTQADEGITRKYGGTGLGLSISSKLIKLMGGKISVQSEKGVGSTFVVELKIEKGFEHQNEEVVVDYENFSTRYPQEILLVEDGVVNQKLVVMMLSKLGYDCTVAENGQVAVDLCRERDFSLIFMDMQMPVMDGVTATSIILEEKPDLNIIAMTANVLDEDREKCLSAGMKEFVTKPIKISDFISIITKYSE